MKIALARCQHLPAFESDDKELIAQLLSLGVDVDCPVWDDPEIDWQQYALIIPRLTWDYQEKISAFRQWMKNNASTLLNPYEVLIWNFSKDYLKELQTRTVPTIYLTPCSSLEFDQRFEGVYQEVLSWGQHGDIAFAKPMIGANSIGTLRFKIDADAKERLAKHLREYLVDQGVGMLVQPYQKTIESHGEFSLIFFTGVYSHAVQKKPVLGDYKAQIDYGAIDQPFSPDEEWIKSAGLLLDQVKQKHQLNDPLLYARCDYLLSHDLKPQLIELELIEPSLFFRGNLTLVKNFTDAIVKKLDQKKA
jgi:hypothetical protein